MKDSDLGGSWTGVQVITPRPLISKKLAPYVEYMESQINGRDFEYLHHILGVYGT